MDLRPPRSAVALKHDLAGGDSPAHQIVDHKIESQPRRDAVGGRIAENNRGEPVICEAQQLLLDPDLRNRVRGEWVELGGLLDHSVLRRAVIAARRGEYEALDTHLTR